MVGPEVGEGRFLPTRGGGRFCRGRLGLAIGLAAAYGLTHFVASFLFGIKHDDPVALAASVLVLASVAILAGYAPARRASRVDPMAALRHE
jgi:ABC-type antimicrobial peptide transport system permease subunit